jgi:hypothetical protein
MGSTLCSAWESDSIQAHVLQVLVPCCVQVHYLKLASPAVDDDVHVKLTLASRALPLDPGHLLIDLRTSCFDLFYIRQTTVIVVTVRRVHFMT